MYTFNREEYNKRMEWVPGCEIRYVYPLGTLFYSGKRRMGKK